MNRYDGWYLLDHHKNRNSTQTSPASDPDTRPWYTTRNRCHHGHDRPHLLVVHDPETLHDFDPPYDEAERVARYGATTTRASWHDSIDADSIIPMLPPEYTAWHVRGFNRCAIGMEVGAMAGTWNQAPAAWLEGVMANTATRAAEHMAAYGIPPVLLFEPGKRYTAPLDPSGFGLISHHALDPTRRTDPGFTFPWNDLLNRLEEDDMQPPSWAVQATQWHIDNGIYTESAVADVDEDVEFHRQTVFRHRMWQRVISPAIAKERARVDSLSVRGLPREEVVRLIRDL